MCKILLDSFSGIPDIQKFDKGSFQNLYSPSSFHPASSPPPQIQSNLNGSNIFGTMEIRSKHE